MLVRRPLHFNGAALTAMVVSLVVLGAELFLDHWWELRSCISYLCVPALVQATVVPSGDLVLRVLAIDLPGLSTILWLQVGLLSVLLFVEESLLRRALWCQCGFRCFAFSNLHDLF